MWLATAWGRSLYVPRHPPLTAFASSHAPGKGGGQRRYCPQPGGADKNDPERLRQVPRSNEPAPVRTLGCARTPHGYRFVPRSGPRTKLAGLRTRPTACPICHVRGAFMSRVTWPVAGWAGLNAHRLAVTGRDAVSGSKVGRFTGIEGHRPRSLVWARHTGRGGFLPRNSGPSAAFHVPAETIYTYENRSTLCPGICVRGWVFRRSNGSRTQTQDTGTRVAVFIDGASGDLAVEKEFAQVARRAETSGQTGGGTAARRRTGCGPALDHRAEAPPARPG